MWDFACLVPLFGEISSISVLLYFYYYNSVLMFAIFSRYCDLCKTTRKAEAGLESQNVVGSSSQQFPDDCTEIKKGNIYSLSRSITLPEQDKLDLGWLKSTDTGKDSSVADAFKKKVLALSP